MRKFLSLTAFLLMFFGAAAQQEKVSGRVIGSDGQPLPGVHIAVQVSSPGTDTDADPPPPPLSASPLIGTVTDADGKYTLENLPARAVLRFSSIGYASVDKIVGTNSIINVTMSEDVTSLNEVVVLGYGTTSKTKLINSAVQLDSKVFSQTPYVSADQALQGRVAGLVITTPSGTPGSGMQIRIRGVSSITAGNEPLYVIDGVPVNSGNVQSSTSSSTLNPLASMDPENIESITVLKDASSTAMFGARGASGVIVIKTKRGSPGKTKYNFSAAYGLNNDATPGPAMLTAAQREELYYEAIYNTYGRRNGFTKDQARQFYENNRQRLGFSSQYHEWNRAGRPNNNWADVITHKNARYSQYDISASGGGDGGNFFTSLGYTKQDGTVIGSAFERISGQLNLDKAFSKRLHFSSQNSGSYSIQNGTLEQSAYFSSPRAVKYFMSPTYSPYNPDGSINMETGTSRNPLYLVKNDIDQSNFTRVFTSHSLAYELPVKNLRFTTRASLDWQFFKYKNFWNREYGDGASTSGNNTTVWSNNLNYVLQNFFDYEAEVASNHTFTFKILHEFQRNNYTDLIGVGNSFPAAGLTNLANAGTPTTSFSSYSNWKQASYMGAMEYSAFDARYLLNASIRSEGNSRFSPSNRWGTFWSAGLGWNIFKENFLKDFSALSNLKLRASYGKTGNANINLNLYQPTLNFTAAYGGVGASVPGNYGNDNLSWETSYPFEAGADIGFFDERITARFTYFYRTTKDLLQDVPITRSTGYSAQLRNTGSLSNQGIEIEANFAIVKKKDFNISIGGNVSTANNKVLTLGKTPTGENIAIQGTYQKTDIGHPVNGWFMRTWKGVNPQSGNDTWHHILDNGRIVDTTNYNAGILQWQGVSPIPTLTAGINLHGDFKGIFLDVSGYYSAGNKVYEDWSRYTEGANLYSLQRGNGTDALLDRWQKSGDVARFPMMELTTPPSQPSSKFLYDGDFLRIKSLTLGYNLNNKVAKRLKIEGVQLFIRASNFFTWVKDPRLKYDPETAMGGPIAAGKASLVGGLTSLTTPPVKSILTGINIRF